jgi:Ser/Thr protein kinase RdoA (MazF antagonist)
LKTNKQNFFDLDPNIICLSAEKHGFVPTGEIQQLNSIENRVFDIKLEPDSDFGQLLANQSIERLSNSSGGSSAVNLIKPSIIAKFYRPERWSELTIQDEHNFEIELHNESLKVGVPYTLKNNKTIDYFENIPFAFFEKIRGRLIQEFMPSHFKQIGRWLAQLHNIGEAKVAMNRNEFGPTSENKWEALDQMRSVISLEVQTEYYKNAEILFKDLDDRLADLNYLRIHGDLHRGNILESPEGLVVVDFDDFLNGPAVQDFWMLFQEENYAEADEFENFVSGYEELRLFPFDDLILIPLLRAYRLVSYSAWIHKRWSDPSFPRLFPQFETYNYWAEQNEELKRLIHL